MRWETQIRRNLSFAELEALQQEANARVRENPTLGVLLISEPAPTFTGGRSAKASDILWNEAEQLRHKTTLARVSRGGKWTYHGPGQIVLYPVVRLGSLGWDSRQTKDFVEALRQCVQRTLSHFGVNSEAKCHPYGLFVGGKKLVSFGIAVQDGICTHGLALYISDQSEYFRGIVPCGTTGQETTSLNQLGIHSPWETVCENLVESIKEFLHYDKH